MNNQITPLHIDNMLLKNVSWDKLVDAHNKIKCSKEIIINGLPLPIINVLMYIRSFSRIYIDTYVAQYKTDNPDTPFYMFAAGSTNITSDYDVQLIGKGASEMCKNIVYSFTTDTGNDLATVADSNVYISPGFIHSTIYKYPEWFKYVISDSETGQAFPLPIGEIALKKEKDAVLKRASYVFPTSIADRYFSMITKTRYVEDEIFYNKTHNTALTEGDFWDLLHSINFDAMEAYITLSTIIIVVLEIQMKINIEGLTRDNYIIAAYENLINFKDHSSHSTDEELLKASKYIYRILYCLLKADILGKLTKHMSTVEYIVSKRGNPNEELFNSSQFSQYKKLIRSILGCEGDIKGRISKRVHKDKKVNKDKRVKKAHK